MPELFHRLPRNVITVFSGRNLLWHVLAIVLTMAVVMSGGDWSYFQLARRTEVVRFARPAIVLGSMVPILGTLVILLVGESGKIAGSSRPHGLWGRRLFSAI